jgi:hypothetical protein
MACMYLYWFVLTRVLGAFLEIRLVVLLLYMQAI